MALDAGTVNIKINAQTGDTKQRIDEVKNSLDNLGNSSKLVSAAMALAVSTVASKAADLAGNLYSSLAVPMQRASRDINSTGKAAQDELAALGAAAASVADNIPIVGNAIAGVITGHANLAVEEMNILNAYKDDLKTYIDEVAAYADGVLTNSALTGFSTETVQVYEKLQGITDVDFSTITTGMRGFNDAIKEAKTGSGDAKDALDELGVSLTDVDGNAKSVDELWREVIDAFQKTGDSLSDNEKWSLAVELFGSRAAQAMLPIINNSDLSYENLLELAGEIGILNDTELDLAGSVQDLKDLSDAAKQTTQDLMGLQLADVTKASSQAELDYYKTYQSWIRGDINPDTGKPYTKADTKKAFLDWKWQEKEMDAVTTNLAEIKKDMEESVIEIVNDADTYEEAVEALDKLINKDETAYNPYIPPEMVTDSRTDENKQAYAESLEPMAELYTESLTYLLNYNTDKFGIGMYNTNAFDYRFKKIQEELGAWDLNEVTLTEEAMAYVISTAATLQDLTNRSSTEDWYEGINEFLELGGLENPIYAYTALADLLTPQPTVEQKTTAEEPSVNNGTINNYGDNSGNTNSNNTTTNTYYYNSDISTGDMN